VKSLKTATLLAQPMQVPSYNHGHMISYFVSCTAMDGLPAGDIKLINKAAKIYMNVDMYELKVSYMNRIYLKASYVTRKCKRIVFTISMSIDLNSYDNSKL